MTDLVAITSLPDASALGGSELMAIVQGGETRKAAITAISLLVQSLVQAALNTEIADRISGDAAKLNTSAVASDAEAIAGSITTKWVPPHALKAAIDSAIAALIASAPGALNTLNELAVALGNDPNFATTITNALALKASTAALTTESDARIAADSAEVSRATAAEALKLDKSAVASDAEAIAGTLTTKWVPPHALKAALDSAIAALVASAPGALDTLNELAAALGNDANFSATVTNALALKATTAALQAEIDRATAVEALKVAQSAFDAMFRVDTYDPMWLWKARNLNGDILFGFNVPFGGLKVPNLDAMAVSAQSMSAPVIAAGSILSVGGAVLSATVNPGNLAEWRSTLGDIIARIDTTGTHYLVAANVAGNLAVGGTLSAFNLAVSGTFSAGTLAIGAASITATSANLVEWRTPVGDIVARIDNAAQAHFASVTVHGDLVVTGKILGSLDSVQLPPSPFATVSVASLAAVNGWTAVGVPGGSSPQPLLSNDSATYGVRHSHISESVAWTGNRVWTMNYGKIGVAHVMGYISGNTLTVLSIDNPYHVEAGAVVTGAGVTDGTAIASFVATWQVSVSQTVGSSGSPVSMTLTGPDGTTAITGYISGTTLTILTAATPAYVLQDTSLTGAGVTTCTLDLAIANVGTATYTISPSQTVGSAGAPVSLTLTDGAGNGAEGYSGFAFLRYCDDLDAGVWAEPLYFVAPNPLTDSVIGQIGTDQHGRLIIATQTSRDGTQSVNYGYVIQNPEAVSGSFAIGRANYLSQWSVQALQAIGDTMYMANDAKPTGSYYATQIGLLNFSGWDGISFTALSPFVRPPAGKENFSESSFAILSGNRARVYLRSTEGIYEAVSGYDLASWGTSTKWKDRTGWDSPVSRAYFARSPSGRLVALWNKALTRTNLTLALSEDEGETWPWSVTIESRSLGAQSPSYGSLAFGPDGFIYTQYDFGRRPDAAAGKRILLGKVSEELVRTGAATEGDVRKYTVAV